MIKLSAIGNLGRDAEVRTVNGKNVINFTIAHTEKYKDQVKTTWIECSYWTDRTGIAPYLLKGTQVHVEGTPEVRTFEKKDGSAGASLGLRVKEVYLLGSRSNGNGEKTSKPAESSSDDENTGDLPF